MAIATRHLPRTRSFQRRRTWTAWWAAAIIAVTVNLGLVMVLSQVSHLHVPLPEPPLSVRTLRQVEPDPPSSPPEPLIREVPQKNPPPLAVALPALDLPAPITPAPNLPVPDLTHLERPLDLPLAVPAFAALSSDAPVLDNATQWPRPAALDEPAQLESTFDLERFYPRLARVRGINGQTHVRLTILEDGRVLTAHIYRSTPPGVFEQATRDLALSLKFRPGRIAGKPVSSTKDLIIDWTIK
jgi:TonB family protein